MRSRDIVGKTVREINQRRLWNRGRWETEVYRIIFTDGTWIYLVAAETDDTPFVSIKKGEGKL